MHARMAEEVEEGVVLACGRASDHQLGFITNEPTQWKFRPIRSLSRIVQVSCGLDHNLALDALGRVFAWGSNRCGKLGLGDEVLRATPVLIDELGRVNSSVSCGHQHSACVTRGGKLFTWGDNTSGQLGQNVSQVAVFSPRAVSTSRRGHSASVVMISLGSRHTLVLMSDGTVLGCGSNAAGELGVSGQRLDCNRKLLNMDEIEKDGQDADLVFEEKNEARKVVGVAAGVDASVVWLASGAAIAMGLGAKPQRTRYKNEFFVHILDCALSRETMLLLDDQGRVFMRERRGLLSAKESAAAAGKQMASSPDVKVKAAAPNRRSVDSRGFWSSARRIDSAFPYPIRAIAAGPYHCAVVDEAGLVYTWGHGEGLGDENLSRTVKSRSEGKRNGAGSTLKVAGSQDEGPGSWRGSSSLLLPVGSSLSVDVSSIKEPSKPILEDRQIVPCERITSGAFGVACGAHHTAVLVGFRRPSLSPLDKVGRIAGRDQMATDDHEDEADDGNEELIFGFEHGRDSTGTLSTSPHSEFPSLMSLCEHELIRTMDCFNFHHCWELAESHGMDRLARSCEEFILSNLEMLSLLNPNAMRMFDLEGGGDEFNDPSSEADESEGEAAKSFVSDSLATQTLAKSDDDMSRTVEKKTTSRQPRSQRRKHSGSSSMTNIQFTSPHEPSSSNAVESESPKVEPVEANEPLAESPLPSANTDPLVCVLCNIKLKSELAMVIHLARSHHNRTPAQSSLQSSTSAAKKIAPPSRIAQRERKKRFFAATNKNVLEPVPTPSPSTKPSWGTGDEKAKNDLRSILKEEERRRGEEEERRRQRMEEERRKLASSVPSVTKSNWTAEVRAPKERVSSDLREIIKSEDERARREASTSRPLQKSVWGFIPKVGSV